MSHCRSTLSKTACAVIVALLAATTLLSPSATISQERPAGNASTQQTAQASPELSPSDAPEFRALTGDQSAGG
jgi:hypothetical protein